jgi:phage I-like protein
MNEQLGRFLLSIDLSSQDQPPREVCILRYGENKTVYGAFWLSKEGAEEAVRRFREHGADLPFDIDHLSEEPQRAQTPEMLAARGWFGLSAREDGLWLTAPPYFQEAQDGIFWTPPTRTGFANKEWRYFSPSVAYRQDADGLRWVVGVTSCALTHYPATIGQKSLLHAGTGPAAKDDPSMDDEKKIALAARTITGKTDEGEVRGALEALKQKAARADELEVQLAAEKKQRNKAEAQALLSSHRHKVTPAEEPELLKKGEEDPAWLKGFLSVKASVVGGSAPEHREPTPAQANGAQPLQIQGKAWEQLGPIEKHNLHQRDKALYDALKRDFEQRQRARL